MGTGSLGVVYFMSLHWDMEGRSSVQDEFSWQGTAQLNTFLTGCCVVWRRNTGCLSKRITTLEG